MNTTHGQESLRFLLNTLSGIWLVKTKNNEQTSFMAFSRGPPRKVVTEAVTNTDHTSATFSFVNITFVS